MLPFIMIKRGLQNVSILTVLTILCSVNITSALEGKSFIIGLLEHKIIDSFPKVRLYISTTSSDVIPVSITTPRLRSANTWWTPEEFNDIHGNVSAAAPYICQLPFDIHMFGAGIEDKGILITSDSDITVHVQSVGTKSSDGYVALPLTSLGTEYYVMSHIYQLSAAIPDPELFDQGYSQFGIVATVPATLVHIHLPAEGVTVDYVGYGATRNGNKITLILEKYQTYQLQSKSDLTGTRIVTSDPVVVLSGSSWTPVSTVTSGDYILEILPPVHEWGTDFFTVPTATRTSGDMYKIISSKDGTDIQITTLAAISWIGSITLNMGQYQTIDIPSESHAFIRSNKPVLMAQFSKSYSTDGNVHSDPFMSIVTPMSQWSDHYYFRRFQSYQANASYVNQLVNIAVPTLDLALMRINNRSILPEEYFDQWRQIPRTSYSYLTLTPSEEFCEIYNAYGTGFFAMQYGHNVEEAYGFSMSAVKSPQRYFRPTTTTTTLSTVTTTAPTSSEWTGTTPLVTQSGSAGTLEDVAISTQTSTDIKEFQTTAKSIGVTGGGAGNDTSDGLSNDMTSTESLFVEDNSMVTVTNIDTKTVTSETSTFEFFQNASDFNTSTVMSDFSAASSGIVSKSMIYISTPVEDAIDDIMSTGSINALTTNNLDKQITTDPVQSNDDVLTTAVFVKESTDINLPTVETLSDTGSLTEVMVTEELSTESSLVPSFTSLKEVTDDLTTYMSSLTDDTTKHPDHSGDNAYYSRQTTDDTHALSSQHVIMYTDVDNGESGHTEVMSSFQTGAPEDVTSGDWGIQLTETQSPVDTTELLVSYSNFEGSGESKSQHSTLGLDDDEEDLLLFSTISHTQKAKQSHTTQSPSLETEMFTIGTQGIDITKVTDSSGAEQKTIPPHTKEWSVSTETVLLDRIYSTVSSFEDYYTSDKDITSVETSSSSSVYNIESTSSLTSDSIEGTVEVAKSTETEGIADLTTGSVFTTQELTTNCSVDFMYNYTESISTETTEGGLPHTSTEENTEVSEEMNVTTTTLQSEHSPVFLSTTTESTSAPAILVITENYIQTNDSTGIQNWTDMSVNSSLGTEVTYFSEFSVDTSTESAFDMTQTLTIEATNTRDGYEEDDTLAEFQMAEKNENNLRTTIILVSSLPASILFLCCLCICCKAYCSSCKRCNSSVRKTVIRDARKRDIRIKPQLYNIDDMAKLPSDLVYIDPSVVNTSGSKHVNYKDLYGDDRLGELTNLRIGQKSSNTIFLNQNVLSPQTVKPTSKSLSGVSTYTVNSTSRNSLLNAKTYKSNSLKAPSTMKTVGNPVASSIYSTSTKCPSKVSIYLNEATTSCLLPNSNPDGPSLCAQYISSLPPSHHHLPHQNSVEGGSSLDCTMQTLTSSEAGSKSSSSSRASSARRLLLKPPSSVHPVHVSIEEETDAALESRKKRRQKAKRYFNGI